jgi:serine/threonine protein kinase
MSSPTVREEGGARETQVEQATDKRATRIERVTDERATRDEGGVVTAPPDREGPRQTTVDLRVVVPKGLAAKYGNIRQLPTRGAEADMLLANDAQGRSVVIKLYRTGFKPDTDVLVKIAEAGVEHVVKLFEYGTEDGVPFEVMEYIGHGSLRDFMKGPLPPDQATDILRELSTALAHLHQRKAGNDYIIHRDLKPENILIRAFSPFDLVLTDFGISSISRSTQHATNRSMTTRYAAPEAHSGTVSPAVDWWSLGMIMHELLTGESPFGDASDQAVAYQVVSGKVPLDKVDDPHWKMLLRGLFVRNPKLRWGAEEVGRWLNGEDMPVADQDEESNSQATWVPYPFAGEKYANPEALATGLAAKWNEGIEHLLRNYIANWVGKEVKDPDLAVALEVIAESKLSRDQKLLQAIYKLNSNLPPIWKGVDASTNGLIALASAAKTDPVQQERFEDLLANLQYFEQPDQKQLNARIIEATSQYDKAWSRLPNDIAKKTRPAQQIGLPNLVLVTLNTSSAETLKKSLPQPSIKQAQGCPWFASLGDPSSMTPAEQLVMLAVIKDALEWVAEDERKRRAVEEARLHRIQTAQSLLSEVEASPKLLELYSIAERGTLISSLKSVVAGDETINLEALQARWNTFKSTESTRRKRAAFTRVSLVLGSIATISAVVYLNVPYLRYSADESFEIAYKADNNNDYSTALKHYTNSSKKGNISAKNNLGVMYAIGQGVEKDAYKAVEFYSHAARYGSTRAEENWNALYLGELKEIKDPNEIIRWHRHNAGHTLAEAQYRLGNLYRNGSMVNKDLSEAAILFGMASLKKHVKAALELGQMHEKGEGVGIDYKHAKELYQLAVDQGNIEGKYNLGRMYEKGLGVNADIKEAARLYRSALKDCWYATEASGVAEVKSNLKMRLAGLEAALHGVANKYPSADTTLSSNVDKPTADPTLNSSIKDLTVESALKHMYGNYDSNLKGAVWKVKAPPVGFEWMEGESFLVVPFLSGKYVSKGASHIVFITSALNYSENGVVRPGEGCTGCGVVLGSMIFKQYGNEWYAVFRGTNKYLDHDGVRGGPSRNTKLIYDSKQDALIANLSDSVSIGGSNVSYEKTLTLKNGEWVIKKNVNEDPLP